MRDGVLVSEVRVRGPLSAYAVGFGRFLAGQGYTPGSVRLQMYLVAQLSRWLDAEGLALGLSGCFVHGRRWSRCSATCVGSVSHRHRSSRC